VSITVATLLLVASCTSRSDSPTDAGQTDDAVVADGERLDFATTPDRSDAPAGDVDGSADTALDDADVSPTPNDGADGGCACIPFKDNGWEPPVEISLECFAIRARWYFPYSAYAPDICIDLRAGGYRRVDSYANHNLIGIWSLESPSTEPTYGYFYDATTHALVGAVRSASWSGGDPLSCNPSSQFGKYNQVYAGKNPDCDFSGGGISCPATSQQQVCPSADAGAPDSASDGSTGDADAMKLE
jgi:hypothetical protein